MTEYRLLPEDEYMHPLEEAENFNESMYFNVYDPSREVGGFFRIGNRANEGYAEVTTCLYLPDGRVGFMYGRPEISGNDAFDAGGMTFEVVEPFRELRVRRRGKVLVLEDPLAMADPGTAFREQPRTPCEVELVYTGVSPMYGGEPVRSAEEGLIEADSHPFARGHYEQHVAARGTIRVADEEWEVDGFGLRDHSWGPRYWQSPWWYRWLTANFGSDFGFMLSVIASRDGSRRLGGMILRGGAYELVTEVEVETDWEGDDVYHRGIRARAVTRSGEPFEVTGRVLNLIPLRNRRTSPEGEPLVTRISEGLTEWTSEGRTGYGLSEYLDQIVDGRPVGASG